MRRLLRFLRQSQGLTMVEMMVALVLAAIIFTAGAAALAAGMGGVGFSRQNQQSAELVSEVIEEARGASFASVAVKKDTGALGADVRLTSNGTSWFVDPDGSGSLASEKLIVSDTGSVPLTRTIERNGTRYAISTYVTEPAGANAAYRRVSTVVTWTRDQKTHQRQATTFVANTRRGLPLPRFSMAGDATFTVNASATLVLPLSLTNSGARDRWNLTATTSPTSGWSFVWFVDDDGNGVKDSAETTTLSDTDGDGILDTGLLETDEVTKLLAVADIPVSQPAGTVTVTLKGTSSSDPAFSDTVVDTVIVASQGCSGCTLATYYMRNTASAPADSLLQTVMPLDAAPGGVHSGVPNYDTNMDVDPGRTLKKGASAMTESDATKIVVWERQMAAATKLNGTLTVNLYAAARAFDPAKSGVLRVGVFERSGASLTQLGLVETVMITFGTSYSLVSVPVSVVNATVGKNKYLQVRVIAPGGDDDLWLAYGTDGYRASVSLPVV